MRCECHAISAGGLVSAPRRCERCRISSEATAIIGWVQKMMTGEYSYLNAIGTSAALILQTTGVLDDAQNAVRVAKQATGED